MQENGFTQHAFNSTNTSVAFDIHSIRADFPVLARKVRGKSLIYFDSAASAQKPIPVVAAMNRYYQEYCANIHRGVHVLSMEATDAYEAARQQIATSIHAREPREIIFVRGATEAINLVAQSWGRSHLKSGDEILITVMEHHANIVSWQLIAEQVGAVVKAVPMAEPGVLDMSAFEALLNERTRIVAVGHISNAIGTIHPIKTIVKKAHALGVPVLVDGAQAVPHMPVDVQDLGCDFYVYSGHKLFGPTGIGVLYGRAEILETMPPYQGGGEMIRSVSIEKSTFREIPERFEAGTPHIAGAIGLAEAHRYIESLGWEAIHAHEQDLLHYGTQQLEGVPGLEILGPKENKASVLSFVMEDAHPHDIATILDTEGIAIRGGHHCAQPLMTALGVSSTARASLAFYNTRAEVDRLRDALVKIQKMFSR